MKFLPKFSYNNLIEFAEAVFLLIIQPAIYLWFILRMCSRNYHVHKASETKKKLFYPFY